MSFVMSDILVSNLDLAVDVDVCKAPSKVCCSGSYSVCCSGSASGLNEMVVDEMTEI